MHEDELSKSKDRHEIEIERRKLTSTPSKVLVRNKYMKFPTKRNAIVVSICTRSKLWIALNNTTDVASLTTPSPKTRLYRKGVSS